MTAHDRALELAAAAIDFPLTPAERRELDEHLATCASCRRAVAELRADAAAVLTPVTPLSTERSQVVLAGALRRRRSGPPVRMLAVAALFALGTGAALAVGSQLLDDAPTETPPVVVRPSESPTTSTDPSASLPPSPSEAPTIAPTSAPTSPPTGAPTVSPTDAPSATPTQPPESAGTPEEYVVRADARSIGTAIEIAPSSDGGAYVTVPGEGETVLFRLAADGAVAPGWPLSLPHARCAPPLAAEDGSVRVVCPGEPEGDFGILASQRAFAFDPEGRTLPGWPVDVPCCVDAFFLSGLDVGVDDGSLVFVASRLNTDVEAPDQPTGTSQLVVVTSEGSVTVGAEVPRWPEHLATTVGRGQIGYSIRSDGQQSEITAFDMAGVRPGWPIELEGRVSPPAYLPDGRVAFQVLPADQRLTTIFILDAQGRQERVSAPLPIEDFGPWSGAGEQLLTAMPVAPDGTLRVIQDASAWAINGAGSVLPNWPWIESRLLQYEGYCPPGDTGCGLMRVDPAIGPDGELLVATASPNGGALIVVDVDGSEREGWPVTLTREGSAFWEVAMDDSGVAYAVAIEPESAAGFSATILRLEPDSTVSWGTTLVEP